MTALLYRLLLVMSIPKDLRSRHGDDMAQVFRELHRDARTKGAGAVLSVWWRAITQTVGGGFRDRLRSTGRDPGHRPPRKRRAKILDNLSQDLKFAFRSFVRRPGFSLTAIAIVALGIGATTTIFSVVDAVVLRKLPFPEPERLVYFDHGSHTLPDYTDWLEQLFAFESIAAVFPMQRTLLGEGVPQRLVVGQATANLFPLFGVLPAHGRLLTAADMTGGAQVAVLSHEFWLRQFGVVSLVACYIPARRAARLDPIETLRTE